MSEGGNVVFLKFKSEQQAEDTMAFLACSNCRNKTYTHTIDRPGDYPLVRCAACGSHIGRIGWADNDRGTSDEAS